MASSLGQVGRKEAEARTRPGGSEVATEGGALSSETRRPNPKTDTLVSVTGSRARRSNATGIRGRMIPDEGVFPFESHKYNGVDMVYEPLRPCLLLEHGVYG
jgi:hypothetical protein